MRPPIPFELRWRKSSRSANNGTCVEMAVNGHGRLIRDSKAPDNGTLSLTSPQAAAFLTDVKIGRFDPPA